MQTPAEEEFLTSSDGGRTMIITRTPSPAPPGGALARYHSSEPTRPSNLADDSPPTWRDNPASRAVVSESGSEEDGRRQASPAALGQNMTAPPCTPPTPTEGQAIAAVEDQNMTAPPCTPTRPIEQQASFAAFSQTFTAPPNSTREMPSTYRPTCFSDPGYSRLQNPEIFREELNKYYGPCKDLRFVGEGTNFEGLSRDQFPISRGALETPLEPRKCSCQNGFSQSHTTSLQEAGLSRGPVRHSSSVPPQVILNKSQDIIGPFTDHNNKVLPSLEDVHNRPEGPLMQPVNSFQTDSQIPSTRNFPNINFNRIPSKTPTLALSGGLVSAVPADEFSHQNISRPHRLGS